MFHCNEKFNVQLQPYLNRINHVFCFFVVWSQAYPPQKPLLWPFQKWVYTLWVEAHTQWPFNHRRDCGLYSRGFKGDRWGRSHGSGGLWRFSLHNVQSLMSNIVYTLQVPNTWYVQSLCCANGQSETWKIHTLPHQSLCMSNKPTFDVIISNTCVFE